MPRISTSILRRARHTHPLLPLLLGPCRDLPSARNELRWLYEHAIANRLSTSGSFRASWRQRFRRLCLERSKGKPLQYILGSQPFGELDIFCRPGVLIPRPETEAITSYLASLLSAQPDPPYALSILDLCTGTGCIPLLLQTLLSPIIPNLQFCGVDVSQKAIKLAKENLAHNIRGNHLIASAADEISFVQGDIFQEKEAPWKRQRWDILVSNPPYISPTAFDTTTSRSVRNYEPKTALVPTDSPTGDAFYPRLLHIANRVGAQIILAEVGNITQAARVAGLFCGYYGWKCEIWRDEPAAEQQGGQLVKRRGLEFGVKGAGNGRAVLAWRRGGGRMLGLGYQGKS